MNDYSRIYYKTISIYYLKLSTSKELYLFFIYLYLHINKPYMLWLHLLINCIRLF